MMTIEQRISRLEQLAREYFDIEQKVRQINNQLNADFDSRVLDYSTETTSDAVLCSAS